MGSIDGDDALTIAVVDDDMAVRALIRRILERTFAERGIRVLEGGTGGDAVALSFGTPTPGLLIVNWLMPGLDGAQAIAEIRRREGTENLLRVPIVFESATVPDAPVAGADAILECPFSPRDLVAAVESLVCPALGPGPADRP